MCSSPISPAGTPTSTAPVAGCSATRARRSLAKSIADVILPEEVDRLAQVREQLLGGDTLVCEWTLRRKDGSHMSAEISAKIFADGRWQGLVRDISERKRLEQELRAAEAEQKFLAELGFGAGVDDRRSRDRGDRRAAGRRRDRRRLLDRNSGRGRTATRQGGRPSRPGQGGCLPNARRGEDRYVAPVCRLRRPRDETFADPGRHAGIPRHHRPERRGPSRVARAGSEVVHGGAAAGARRGGRLAGLHQHDGVTPLHRSGCSVRSGRGDARRPGGGEGPPLPDRPARDPAARRRAQHRRPRSPQPAGHDPDAGGDAATQGCGSRSAGPGSRAR